MADPNQGQNVAAFWESLVTDKPTDNFFPSRALFYALKNGGFQKKVTGGRLFEASLEYAQNTTARSYGEYETLDMTRIDVFDCARYDQKVCAVTIQFSNLELARNEGDQKIDVLTGKLDNGRNSHINNLNDQLWGDGTGNGGKDMNGLQNLISITPTTGVVGGINRATFSFWRNRQASGAKTTTAFDNLRAAMTSVFNQCTLGGLEKQPTSAITDRATLEGYESLLVAVEKIERQAKATGGDIAFLNKGIEFKGIPVYYDEAAVAGELRFLNPKFLKLCYLTWMKMLEPVEPANALTRTYRVQTFGNFLTDGSKYLGVVSAIS